MKDRFAQFTISISKLNKLIQKLKTDGMKQFGLKAVDTLCLYQLLTKEDGMLFSEIAENCDLDRALVSRTLKGLIADGMVEKDGDPGKYNAKYSLTEKGREAALQIQDIILRIHAITDTGISEEELDGFYDVLNQLTANLEALAEDSPAVFERMLAEYPQKEMEEIQ